MNVYNVKDSFFLKVEMKDKTPFPVSPKLILKCLYISNLQDSCSQFFVSIFKILFLKSSISLIIVITGIVLRTVISWRRIIIIGRRLL